MTVQRLAVLLSALRSDRSNGDEEHGGPSLAQSMCLQHAIESDIIRRQNLPSLREMLPRQRFCTPRRSDFFLSLYMCTRWKRTDLTLYVVYRPWGPNSRKLLWRLVAQLPAKLGHKRQERQKSEFPSPGGSGNPPFANPGVAEKAPWRSLQGGVAGVYSLLEIPMDSYPFPSNLTPLSRPQ